jgi:hypothetical protein
MCACEICPEWAQQEPAHGICPLSKKEKKIAQKFDQLTPI